LKLSRLIPKRSLAQDFCDAGKIKVNGTVSKSSRDIKTEDEIEITRSQRITLVRVIFVPSQKQVSKSDAPSLYEILSEVLVDDETPDSTPV
jgi:ribosomal 50S subunit-recycling heat shock protein